MVKDFFFSVGIDARKRVVQHQDARIANDGAGDGGALLLPAGKRDAALPDQRLVLIGEAFDIGGDIGSLGSGPHLLVRSVFHAKSDVLTHSIAEQKCLLRHKANASPQRLQRIFADRPAIQKKRSRSGIEDARQQAHQRGLA